MSTLPPFDMFGPSGFTAANVRESLFIFHQVVDGSLNYIARERISEAKDTLTEEVYIRKRASMSAVMEEITRMNNFMHERYTNYLMEQNTRVQELIGLENEMDGYEEHLAKLTKCHQAINAHLSHCKATIAEAVEFDQLTPSLYKEYLAILYPLMQVFDTSFRSYFNMILSFHDGRDIERDLETKKRLYYVQLKKFKDMVEDPRLDDDLEESLATVKHKRQQFYEMRKDIFFKENDVTELEGFKSKIAKLEISVFLVEIKAEVDACRYGFVAHLKDLGRIAKSCYECMK